MVNDGDYFMNAVAKPLQRSKDIFVFFRFVGIFHQQNHFSPLLVFFTNKIS